MTDLEPEYALAIYLKRMKVEQCFRDYKDLLGLDHVMNEYKNHMEQMVALTLLTYVIGLLIGEVFRDVCYGGIQPDQISYLDLIKPADPQKYGPKWRRYSGLFVLLKQRLRIPPEKAAALYKPILQVFAHLIFGNVRTFV